MADFTGLPDAIDLGEVNVNTLPSVLKNIQFAALAKYTVVTFVAAGVIHAKCIPTTAAITNALGQPAAGL